LTALVVAIALVLGGAIGFAWHAPGRSGTWPDVRTWAGFAAIVIGVVIALVQMDLQRRQLASQQSVIEGEATRNQRRDQLLDGQLRELEQRARTFDRQQAEAIGLEWLRRLHLGPIQVITLMQTRRPGISSGCRKFGP
jgi:hypothetical protein